MSIQLHVFTPLFTGKTQDETIILKRNIGWLQWFQTKQFPELQKMCSLGVGIYFSEPGAEIHVPDEKDPDALCIKFPPKLVASVPKGLIARLHLIAALEMVRRNGTVDGGKSPSPKEIVFGCIDGSGAFHYDSLHLLARPFLADPSVDVVLGRRPGDYSGMHAGRKEIEEFEQYLLFRHRRAQLATAFEGYDLKEELLPDGQAGCWAFRLNVATRLPLTASGYEIEFDLLASAIDSGMKIAYTEPLIMPRIPRHTSANAIPMSINKLQFIQRKLCIDKADLLSAWSDFSDRHLPSLFNRYECNSAEADLQRDTLERYRAALSSYCKG